MTENTAPTARPIRTMSDVRAASRAIGSPFFDRRPWSEPSRVVAGPYKAAEQRGYFVTADQYRSHRSAAEDEAVTFKVWEYSPTGPAGFDISPRGQYETQEAAATAARTAAAAVREQAKRWHIVTTLQDGQDAGRAPRDFATAREAAKFGVFYFLTDNGYADRRTANAVASRVQDGETVTHRGHVFRLERGAVVAR